MIKLIKVSIEDEPLKYLYDLRTNPKIDKFLSGFPPADFDRHRDYVRTVQGHLRHIYIASKDLENVGYCQIYDFEGDTVEVGFVIDPEHQGKGLGQELVKVTVEKAIEKFPDKQVILYVLKSNPIGIHIYSKLGFKEAQLPNSNEETLGMIYEGTDSL